MDSPRESVVKARVLADQLMRLNSSSYEAGRYEVAYHVLGAALHCAEELRDLEMATSVEARAAQQQAELDEALPPHPLSTLGASGRGTNPLFSSLARTAHAAASRIKAQMAQEHADAVRRGHHPGAPR
jgi:hypothetical protein